MAVVLVEGITDRIALEAVAAKLGCDLAAAGIEIVPIGGAQAIRRAAAQHEGKRLVGLCDAGEERWFRRVLGDATYVCTADLEVVASQGELETLRNFQNQPAWRGRPVEAQLRRWLQNGGRYLRYPPLLIEALEPERIPRPLVGVLEHV